MVHSGIGTGVGAPPAVRQQAPRYLPPVPPPPPPVPSPGPRADIQGLRAVAVAAVLIYHLWPAALPGGFVGVDVFFVISGFLITGHLLRRPVRSVRDLLAFWARRVRRLIPAASVVLAATLVAAWVWLPATALPRVTREVIASALYVENWALAQSATDYLAADEAPTPVQHFWSLSVEEQFYFVWPLVIGAVVFVAARWSVGRRGWSDSRQWLPVVVVGVVVAVSLAWSVGFTAVNGAAAYFVSTTRFWELGVGGLLATVIAVKGPHRRARFRAAVAWAGLAVVITSVFVINGSMPFPGWAAVFPVAGTAVVIWAAADGVGPDRWWGRRPVQWLGNVSYSLYLWHWPLIVIAPFALGRALSWVDRLAIVVVALGLAGVSKVVVEDGFRFSAVLNRRLGATFAMLGLCLAVTCGPPIAVAARAAADDRAAAVVVSRAQSQAATKKVSCFGASAARTASCDPAGEPLVTTPLFATTDRSSLYERRCWNSRPFTSRRTCTYGAADAPVRIALLGNSHAGHWLPGIEPGLSAQDWRLDTYVASICYTVDRRLDFDDPRHSRNCRKLNRWAIRSIAGNYDLVVMSEATATDLVGVPTEGRDDAARDAYAWVLARFARAGTPVLVVRDTPAMGRNIPDCVAEHGADAVACGAPRETAIERDPLAEAAEADSSGLVSILDVNDLLCDRTTCLPVIGGVIAYFDHAHLTATLARTLEPELTRAIKAALANAEEPAGTGRAG